MVLFLISHLFPPFKSCKIPTCFSPGLSQVVGPSQPVLATVCGDVLLPCRLEPAVDASDMSIEWSRGGRDSPYVYVWSEKEEQESLKHPDYKGRTSMLFSKLKFGDVSLNLSKVKLSDEGKYRCFIPTLEVLQSVYWLIHIPAVVSQVGCFFLIHVIISVEVVSIVLIRSNKTEPEPLKLLLCRKTITDLLSSLFSFHLILVCC
uniref:Ig-like domain-containing protein n=1 Tax=Acanthochromis polyacanthus TaxID=80966 RepID=A0A3Q1G364_9TELE